MRANGGIFCGRQKKRRKEESMLADAKYIDTIKDKDENHFTRNNISSSVQVAMGVARLDPAKDSDAIFSAVLREKL